MSDFYTRRPVPVSRIVFYGFLAVAAVAALGYFQHDPKLYTFAPIAGLIVGGIGCLGNWTRANVRPIPGETYPPLSRFPAGGRWLIVIFVSAGIVATVLNILHKKTLLLHVLGTLPYLLGGLLFCSGGYFFLWVVRRDLKSGVAYGKWYIDKRSTSPISFWLNVSVSLIVGIVFIVFGVGLVLFHLCVVFYPKIFI